jgi:16S rRNA (guanine527-N7)-methyltransferase
MSTTPACVRVRGGCGTIRTVGDSKPTPAVAREIFAHTLPQAERYAALLADAGVQRGLIGPREVDRLWDRHLINCAVLAEAVPAQATVVDVGSGAGLPGLVLAILRPDLSVTLLEPLLRRTNFLTECVAMLELGNVEVRRARAEEVAREFSVDVVTARAVAPLDRLVGWALPLLRPGGQLLALKGERAAQELTDASPVLKRFGVQRAELVQLGHGKVDPPTTIVRVVAEHAPRRAPAAVKKGRGRGLHD